MKKMQHKNFAEQLIKGGYDQNTASILATQLQESPQTFYHTLETLGAGTGQQGEQGAGGFGENVSQLGAQAEPTGTQMLNQPQMQVGQQQQAPQPAQQQAAATTQAPTFAQRIAQGAQAKKQKTAAMEKQEAEIQAGANNLVDMIQTTDRILEALDKGASYGFLASTTAKIAPSALDTLFSEYTEQLDKDADHLVNLASADLKGVPTKLRVQLLQKEKPGLQHSPAVNRQIAERINKQAKAKLGQMQQKYPYLSVDQEEINLGQQLGQGQAAKQEASAGLTQQELSTNQGPVVQDDNGNYYKWDAASNQYRPAQLRG
jgi:hypothetical protein